MQQGWSGGGAVWFLSVNPTSVDMQLPGAKAVMFCLGRYCLHCGLTACSLKSHLVGDGEKNVHTPEFPPRSGHPKPLYSSLPHGDAGANGVVCPTPLGLVLG